MIGAGIHRASWRRDSHAGADIQRKGLSPQRQIPRPDSEPCDSSMKGLLLPCPVRAMTPLVFIGKKIQRRALEGEEVSVLKQRRTARIPSVPEDPHSALAAAKAIASPSRLRKKSSVEGVVCLPSVVQCIFIELAVLESC